MDLLEVCLSAWECLIYAYFDNVFFFNIICETNSAGYILEKLGFGMIITYHLIHLIQKTI